MMKIRRLTAVAVALASMASVAVGVVSRPQQAEAAGPYGADTCLYPLVWRDAGPGDRVCVDRARRTQIAEENRLHPYQVNPEGPYGPNTCREPAVWRDAFVGDEICVTPASRDLAAFENRDQPNRLALDSYHMRMSISDGADVYGHAELWMEPNGDYRYFVHLNNTNAARRNTATVCTVKLLSGNAIAFKVSGALSGKALWWDTKKDWDRKSSRAEIANYWSEIPRDMAWRCTVSTDLNIQGILTGIQTSWAIISYLFVEGE
jgi:hypothetical protein